MRIIIINNVYLPTDKDQAQSLALPTRKHCKNISASEGWVVRECGRAVCQFTFYNKSKTMSHND